MLKRKEILRLVDEELSRAYKKHGRQRWGRHEFYGVIAEEFEEMWQDIKSDATPEKLQEEIIQVIAMGIRYLETGNRYREGEI